MLIVSVIIQATPPILIEPLLLLFPWSRVMCGVHEDQPTRHNRSDQGEGSAYDQTEVVKGEV